MKEQQLLDEIRGALEKADSRENKARQFAEAIRRTGNHRWLIVPVFAPRTQRVQGLIDVESERLNAFTDADRMLLERCASLIAAWWEA